jgi:hypothetical protein
MCVLQISCLLLKSTHNSSTILSRGILIVSSVQLMLLARIQGLDLDVHLEPNRPCDETDFHLLAALDYIAYHFEIKQTSNFRNFCPIRLPEQLVRSRLPNPPTRHVHCIALP